MLRVRSGIYTPVCNKRRIWSRRLRAHRCSAARSASGLKVGCRPHAQKAGDRGAIARTSGDYAIVVSHNPDTGLTRVKMPSGSKKVGCRPVTRAAKPEHWRGGARRRPWLTAQACGRAPAAAQGGRTGAGACHQQGPGQPRLLTARAGRAAGGAEHMPRNGGPGGGRRAHGEAHAEGRQRVPQVQG